MSEPKLFTAQQISRRKTAAIWLIGIWMILNLLDFWYLREIRDWLNNYNLDNERLLYQGFQHAYQLIKAILFTSGLWVVKSVAHPRADKWIKHWIIATFLIFIVNTSTTTFPILIGHWYTISKTSFILYFILALYKIWSLEYIQDNIKVQFLQSVVIIPVLIGTIPRTLDHVSNWMDHLYQCEAINEHLYTELHSMCLRGYGTSFAFYEIIIYLCIIITFICIRNLIRSSLFASTPEEISAFAAQPKPRAALFTAPVVGSLVAVAVCTTGALLLTTYWHDIYNNINIF